MTDICISTWTQMGKEEIGLVIWKDKKAMDMLTSEHETYTNDSCVCKTKEGYATIVCPKCLTEYNKHMGGIDHVDMKRLFCELPIHGLNRW